MLALAASLLVSGCADQAAGEDPPNLDLFFPMGLAIHPDPAKNGDTLYVACGNNDLRYNGGAIQAYDLNALWRVMNPATDSVTRRNVYPPGTPRKTLLEAMDDGDDTTVPCRNVAGKSQVIECEERAYARRILNPHLGNFITDLDAWFVDGRSFMMAPVRGDPSIAWFEIGAREGDDAGRTPDCGQQNDQDGQDGVDEARCDSEHLLTNLLDDEDEPVLPIEPYTVSVSKDPAAQPFAYVVHTGSAALTLVGLDGPVGESAQKEDPRRPIIVDIAALSGGVDFAGGYGVAQRPCDPNDPPDLTQGCTRPLVTSTLRFNRVLTQFTAASPLDGLPDDVADQLSCLPERDRKRTRESGQIECNPQLEAELRFSPGGLVIPGRGLTPVLGAEAYSADGSELFVVQSNPGALIRVDTTVDDTGAVRNFPAGQVEICSRANELELFEDLDAGGRFGLVSCYLVGQVYIVDLDSFQVVSVVQVGTGPHHMLADTARDVVYVANSLDATVSLIDMNRDNPTRFSEIGRLGLQEPYAGDR